ncbi:MAG: hybrid sensor histidine kinase/response regulator [Burkholderiales bacterium]
MRKEIVQPLDADRLANRIGGDVDQRVLMGRQIRLYIENTPEYVALAASAFAVTVAILWPLVPDQRTKLALWAAAHIGTYIARFGAWIAFKSANRNDDATHSRVNWFFLPQLCGISVVSASVFVFLPSPSGDDIALLLALTLFFAVGMLLNTLQVAAYRPLIGPVVASAVLIFAAGIVQLPGSLPKLLMVGAVAIGLMAYRFAGKLNQAFVRSMELSIRNERLVAALEDRTAQLQQQTFAAERAEQDKTRFLAAASHDLRQPMHAISMLVGLLTRRAASGDQEVVDRLERSVEAMDRLFSTILDLSKLDAGVVKPSITAIPLRSIFESIEVHFAPQAASKGLTLTVFPSRAIVRTDRAVLDRILRNFVSNAIKYTTDGRVLVGCRRRGARLLVAVWDTGAGIAAEELERIFEEYYRVGGGPRDRSEGLGLGLSIVRRLAELLGSKVEAVSVPGRGSLFGVEISLAGYLSPEEERISDRVTSESMLAGKLILVVDDEADIRLATESLLRQWGCLTVSAGTFEEVETTLEHELRFPDGIVTDYRIGGPQTGLDAIEAVRRYTGEKTPAIIVTGEELGKAELEIAGSAYPVIAKPLSAEQLRRHLVAALGRDIPVVT